MGQRNSVEAKKIAQACHASIAFLTNRLEKTSDGIFQLKLSEVEQEWVKGIFTKICVKVNTEEELIEIEKKAKEKGLVCHLITDRGLTEFGGIPTNTCLAIGPDEANKIDEITRHLELY